MTLREQISEIFERVSNLPKGTCERVLISSVRQVDGLVEHFFDALTYSAPLQAWRLADSRDLRAVKEAKRRLARGTFASAEAVE